MVSSTPVNPVWNVRIDMKKKKTSEIFLEKIKSLYKNKHYLNSSFSMWRIEFKISLWPLSRGYSKQEKLQFYKKLVF
jgi:hypothetical protein